MARLMQEREHANVKRVGSSSAPQRAAMSHRRDIALHITRPFPTPCHVRGKGVLRHFSGRMALVRKVGTQLSTKQLKRSAPYLPQRVVKRGRQSGQRRRGAPVAAHHPLRQQEVPEQRRHQEVLPEEPLEHVAVEGGPRDGVGHRGEHPVQLPQDGAPLLMATRQLLNDPQGYALGGGWGWERGARGRAGYWSAEYTVQ